MAETTFEEAKRCPKCGEPGEDKKVDRVPGKIGAKLHHIYCMNKRCEWYNTPWMVQENADGSIPPPQDHRGKPKIYEGFQGHDEQARSIVEALEIQRQLETEQGGHGEVRNPYRS